MKKVTYKIMQVLLVALLMLTTFTFNRQDEVKAETLTDVIDTLEIEKEDYYFNGKMIKVSGTWSLPNDSPEKIYQSGDSFSIGVPKELEMVRDTFELKDQSGRVYAVGKMENGKLNFVFTEEIEQKKNRQGGFFLTFKLKVEKSTEDQEVDLEFTDETGKTIVKETITVAGQDDTVVDNEPENFAKGHYDLDYNNDEVKWFIRVNRNGDHKDDDTITIVDRLEGDHILLEDTIAIYPQNHGNMDKGSKLDREDWDQHLELQIDSDLKGFKLVLKNNQQYWYTIDYKTKYNGEDYDSIVQLDNIAYAEGSQKGSIPVNKDESVAHRDVEIDLRGWASGQNVYGTFEILKIDAQTKKPLPGATFELKHNFYESITQEATSDEDGIARFENLIDGLYTVKEIKAPEGYEAIPERKILIKYDNNKQFAYTIENHREPTEIKVEKNWQDQDGESIAPYSNVKFELYQKGSDKVFREAYLLKDQEYLVFKNLPSHDANGELIEYEVREVPIKGFESSVEKKDNNFVFTNKIATKDLTVHKKWLGANSKSTSAKEDIVVVLSKTVNGATQEVERKKLTKDMSKVTFKDLPLMDKKGHEISYSIKEIAEGDYKTSVEVISEDEIVISNQIKVNKIDYEVNKKWFNAEGNEVKGDELETIQDIEIELLQNGQVFKTKTLPKGESRLVFKNLDDKDVSGEPYVYTVREKKLENFEVKYDHKDRQTDIENHYVVPKTNIKGVKVWKDLEGNDIGSHSAIEIILKANGKEEKRFELAKDSYDFEFENLDVTDKNGKKINYSLEEVEVNGFTSKIELDDENYKNGYKATITNTKEVEKTDIRGRKIWLDAKGAMLDSSLEEAITVDLLCDGEVFRSIELEKGEYEFSFKDLDKTDENGVAYEYEVVERDLSGFISHVSYDEETQQFIISNKQKEPEVPEPEEPTEPEVPEPEEPTEPEVPEPEEPTEPEVPEPEKPTEPEVPEPEKPTEPEVPEPEKPTEPEVPEPEEPTEPEVLVPEEPEVEEVDSVNIEPKEPEVEEVDSVNIEPEEPEVEEVLEAYVLPQTGQGVSGIVYTGLAGFILGLFLYLKDRKDQ